MWKKQRQLCQFHRFICCIWKILVIILHLITGPPAKPEDHKNIMKASVSMCLVGLRTRDGKCFR